VRKPALKTVWLLAGILVAGNVTAHGIWVEQRRGNLELVYGDGPADDAYKTSKLRGAWGYDRSGDAVVVRAQHLESHVRLLPQGPVAAIAASYSNGYYTRDAEGKFLNRRRSEVPGATYGSSNWKYTLTILQPGARIPAKIDEVKLLVRPEKDPTTVKAGETLPVQVLYDGKPVADVELKTDYKGNPQDTGAKTDKNGRASITVRNRGLNVISASYRSKVDNDPDADEIAMNSTLTFVGAKP